MGKVRNMNGLSALGMAIAVIVIAYTWHTAPHDDDVKSADQWRSKMDTLRRITREGRDNQ